MTFDAVLKSILEQRYLTKTIKGHDGENHRVTKIETSTSSDGLEINFYSDKKICLCPHSYDEMPEIIMTYSDEISSFGDVMTVEEFKESCDGGGFIDYDGFGHPCKDGKSNDNVNIIPSRRSAIPSDATHIVWFNR